MVRFENNSKGFSLITGAARGIGKALAWECAKKGIPCVLVDLPGTGLSDTAEDLKKNLGVDIRFLEQDLIDPYGPLKIRDWIVSQGIYLYILINNAGVSYNKLFLDSTMEENENLLNLNILSTVKMTRTVLPLFSSPGNGFVLNVSSLSAFYPMPYMPVYASSKSFVLNFTLALRAELLRKGISVSALCPNGVKTNPECRAKIAAQGLAGRVFCHDAEFVAREGIKGLFNNKAVIIPGWPNRLLGALSRIVPRKLIYLVVSKHWGKTAEGSGQKAESGIAL